jgi:hypothetical protein
VISLPDLLRRFRRTWAPPGAALERVAPPVDAAARLRDELHPVLEAIAEIQRRATAARTEGDTKAAALLDTAEREADRATRKAEAQAPSMRAAAAERKHHAVDAEVTSVLAAARGDAERIGAQCQERLPRLLDVVRTCVLNGPGASS